MVFGKAPVKIMAFSVFVIVVIIYFSLVSSLEGQGLLGSWATWAHHHVLVLIAATLVWIPVERRSNSVGFSAILIISATMVSRLLKKLLIVATIGFCLPSLRHVKLKWYTASLLMKWLFCLYRSFHGWVGQNAAQRLLHHEAIDVYFSFGPRKIIIITLTVDVCCHSTRTASIV